MTFSLIVATVNRVEPLTDLLDSISRTPEAAGGLVQVILVDQNQDDRLATVLEPRRKTLEITHLRSKAGLSRARNAALARASGDVIGFPDDDCRYETDTLSSVANLFDRYANCDGLSGRALSYAGQPYNLRWPKSPEKITRARIWRQAISFSIFLRRRVVEAVGEFNESLGLGSGTPWGSGEETDYMLRALQLGFDLRFDPSIQVRHPEPVNRFDRSQRDRAYSYAMGMGRVLQTHGYPVTERLKYVLRPALGSLLFAMRGQFPGASYYSRIALGRLRGGLLQ